jgi:hypothetical protein
VSARIAALLALCAALAAGCGDGDDVGTTTTVAMLPTTSTAASTTTGGEVSLPDLVGDWDNGELFLQIIDDGSYQVLESADSDTDTPLFGGFLARDGAELNFVTNVFGECAGMTGVYAVELAGEQMTLTLVDDPCSFRAARFTEPWELVT